MSSNPEVRRRWYANLPQDRRQAIIDKQAARNVRLRAAALERGECVCGAPLAVRADGAFKSGCSVCLAKASINRANNEKKPEQVGAARVWGKVYQRALREARAAGCGEQAAREHARATARAARQAFMARWRAEQGEAA